MGKWLNGAMRLQLRMEEREERLAWLEHKLSLPIWAELDSGASVRAGDRVRFALHEYECIAAHTKTLARHPRNTEYWRQVEL